jgi:hypothetical protein
MDVSLDHAAYPYRTGHGRPLEPPTNSSTRNPQSATRPMGVAETSPSVSRRDGEGVLKTSRRALPDRLERAQARGLDARLHLLDCTKAAHSKIPSSRLRLARGHTPPSGGLRPVRGSTPTSSGLRLARGSAPPSSRLRLARGRSARARPFPYVGAGI